jgi:hypothetical protein
MNLPSHLEHMPEQTRDDIGLLCFLFKIRDEPEVRKVFGLVGRSCERDINVFTRDPLVEVIFNLQAV